MLSTFNSISNLNRKFTGPIGPVMQSIAQNANGLNLFTSVTMNPNCSISDDGQYLFVLTSSSSTQAAPRYSTNGGSSWLASSFSPVLAPSSNCWGVASSSNGQYIILVTDATGYPYKSIDYGATFTAWTATNFIGGVTPNSAKWMGGVSDDGVVWTFGCTANASVRGLYLCVNGSSTIANDRFTRYFSSYDVIGSSCSISGNHIFGTLNTTGAPSRHVYSNDRGVTWNNATTTIAGTSLQCQPLISNNGKKMWTITYNGSTQVSNYVDLDVSTTWSLEYGVSQWGPGPGYAMGLPNLADTDCSSSMKLMFLTLTSGTWASSNNAMVTTDGGATWSRFGSLIPALASIKIQKGCCSKNGKYMLLVGSTSTFLYKITFPTENV